VLEHEALLGPARVIDMRSAGVAVGIGKRREKENNNLDLFEEMKFASLLQKVTTLDPTTGDPGTSLGWPRSRARRRSGLDEVTGSLEPGKRADVVAVDLRQLHTTPVMHGEHFNVAAHLVFAAHGQDVRMCGVTAFDWSRVGGCARWTRMRCARPARPRPRSCFERRAPFVPTD
jgi:5-methylthioadenosine/S-adenosylhomocysteine deaminase